MKIVTGPGIYSQRNQLVNVIIQFKMLLHFTGDFVSAVSLWHKRAVKKSDKKCRFATFTRCLRIATVLAHAHTCNYLSTTHVPFYSLDCARDFRYMCSRPCDGFRVPENGAGLGTRLVHVYYRVPNFRGAYFSRFSRILLKP